MLPNLSRLPSGTSVTQVGTILDDQRMSADLLSLIERFVDDGLDINRNLTVGLQATVTTQEVIPRVIFDEIEEGDLGNLHVCRFQMYHHENVHDDAVPATRNELSVRGLSLWDCMLSELEQRGFKPIQGYLSPPDDEDGFLTADLWATLHVSTARLFSPSTQTGLGLNDAQWVETNIPSLITQMLHATVERFRADVHPRLLSNPTGPRVFEVDTKAEWVVRKGGSLIISTRYELYPRLWKKEGYLWRRVAKGLRLDK